MLQWGRDLVIAEMAEKKQKEHDERIVLQWGRDLVIAEMPTTAHRCLVSAVLQWGRDLVIAEISAICC